MPQYTQEQREIFEYSDGTQDLKADPLEVEDRYELFADRFGLTPDKIRENAHATDVHVVSSVMTVDGQMAQAPAFNEDGTPKMVKQLPTEEARQRWFDMICYAHQVQPFDARTGAGMTRRMLIELWNQFTDWIKKKYPEAVVTPTSSEPTAEASLPV